MNWIPGQLEARPDRSEINDLAILGGAPIRKRQWPKWPRADATTQRNLLDVLHSTKWTLSGQSDRALSYERRFATAFAGYCGRSFGVPCSSGTAALTMALLVLGIGPGDEVLVPAIAWVACASAVNAVGARPILVDIDPTHLTMSLDHAEKQITPQCRALLAVHLYSSLMSVDATQVFAKRYNLFMIEDASQAHGAMLEGRRAGAFGDISIFSMQQSKLLAAGEGGICLTDDPVFYRRLQQLRADGRIYADELSVAYTSHAADHWMREIVPCGEVAGRNLCMSEFHAAILLDRLNLLDIENQQRHLNFKDLAERLHSRYGEQIILITGCAADQPTYYRICLRLSDNLLEGLQIEDVARALTVELSLPVEPIDRPLPVNPLYRPWLAKELSTSVTEIPHAMRIARQCLTLPHWSLLGNSTDIDDILAALDKVLITQRKTLHDAVFTNPKHWWHTK